MCATMVVPNETGRHRANGPPPAPRNEVVMQETPYGYCHCGCGQKTTVATRNSTRDGLVKGEPRTFIHGHVRKLTPEYVVDETTGCWLWQRYIGTNGYGAISAGRGSSRFAHRVYYEQAKGPIPAGLTIDHLCRNKACVNPDHLEAISTRENTLRCPEAPAAVNAAKTHCIHGHEYTPENTGFTAGPNPQRWCRTCKNAAWRRWYRNRSGHTA